MKPKRNPAGTAAFPRDRLKARNLSQMACVSTFQQGSAAFAALITSAVAWPLNAAYESQRNQWGCFAIKYDIWDRSSTWGHAAR